MTHPTQSQRPITESGRSDNSDHETTDVMEPTSSQRAAEPVDAAADPSTRAVMPDNGHQPDQKPHPDEYPQTCDNQQADPETPAERGSEPPAVRRNLPPPAEATAYANADAGHDTADEPTRAPSDGKLAPSHLADDPVIALWGTDLVERYRGQWRELQLRFVNDPHAAPGEAAGLVEEAVQSLTDAITAQKQTLDGWQSADSDDTEVLRVAMRRYRDLLDRLLDP
jgi:hypothetical protein